MSQENVELMAAALEALNARDADAVRRLAGEEMEWHPALTAGGHLERKVYRGKLGMVDFWEDLDAVFDEARFHVEKIEPVGSDRVLYYGRVTARGKSSQVPLDSRVWGLWQVRDGEFVRGMGFLSEAEALEAAGLSE